MKQVVIGKGAMRSGNTVLRLILGKTFNEYSCFEDYEYRWSVSNTHGYENITHLNPYLITTWRDPRDVLCSLVRIEKKEWTDERYVTGAVQSTLNMFNEIRKIEDENPNKLILKYENWHDDFDHLFNILEQTFKGTITNEIRSEIKSKFSKSSIKEYQSQFRNFTQYHPDTHIHGDHVNTGLSEWEDIIPFYLQENITNKFQPFINYWNAL